MGISSFDVGQMINGRGGAAHKKTPSRLQSGRRETRGTTSVQGFIAESLLRRPQTRAARCIRRTGDRLLAALRWESCSEMYSARLAISPCTDRRLSVSRHDARTCSHQCVWSYYKARSSGCQVQTLTACANRETDIQWNRNRKGMEETCFISS